MKTYYTFTTPPDPAQYHPRGGYHWMSLPTGGYVVALDSGAIPASGWTELPHLLDPTTPAGLTAYGCLATDTMFKAAVKLGAVNSFFKP